MDLNKSGGPMRPVTITNSETDETFHWEGMTLFDYYVGQLLITGMAPLSAINHAARTIELRNKYLMGDKE